MAPSGRVTIADVAAASGVGVGTVSRVINGGANVRESTRRSVLTVIKQLGYRPSYLAASLSRGTPRSRHRGPASHHAVGGDAAGRRLNGPR